MNDEIGNNSEENANLSVKKKKTGKKIALVVIIAIAILAVAFGVTNNLKIQKKKSVESYGDNLSSIDETMLNGASYAETTGAMIHDIWYDSVFENHRSETSNYISGTTDFNGAIENYRESDEYKKASKLIEKSIDKANDLMKKLKNPPDEYQDAYDDLKKYYNDFISFTDLALNPTGSLTTYTDSYNSLDSKVSSDHKSFQIYL